MVKHLWPNFLTDAQAYDAAERFWESLWNEQIDPRGLHRDWQPWINSRFADGTAFMDGNPIFSRISLRERRAVRIIQNEPASADVVLDFWLNRLSPEAGTAAGVIELVVACELSNEAAHNAAEWISSWVNDGRITLQAEFAEIGHAEAGAEEWEPASDCQLVA